MSPDVAHSVIGDFHVSLSLPQPLNSLTPPQCPCDSDPMHKFLVQRYVAHPWTLGKKGFIWELGFLGEPLVI